MACNAGIHRRVLRRIQVVYLIFSYFADSGFGAKPHPGAQVGAGEADEREEYEQDEAARLRLDEQAARVGLRQNRFRHGGPSGGIRTCPKLPIPPQPNSQPNSTVPGPVTREKQWRGRDCCCFSGQDAMNRWNRRWVRIEATLPCRKSGDVRASDAYQLRPHEQ